MKQQPPSTSRKPALSDKDLLHAHDCAVLQDAKELEYRMAGESVTIKLARGWTLSGTPDTLRAILKLRGYKSADIETMLQDASPRG